MKKEKERVKSLIDKINSISNTINNSSGNPYGYIVTSKIIRDLLLNEKNSSRIRKIRNILNKKDI